MDAAAAAQPQGGATSSAAAGGVTPWCTEEQLASMRKELENSSLNSACWIEAKGHIEFEPMVDPNAAAAAAASSVASGTNDVAKQFSDTAAELWKRWEIYTPLYQKARSLWKDVPSVSAAASKFNANLTNWTFKRKYKEQMMPCGYRLQLEPVQGAANQWKMVLRFHPEFWLLMMDTLYARLGCAPFVPQTLHNSIDVLAQRQREVETHWKSWFSGNESTLDAAKCPWGQNCWAFKGNTCPNTKESHDLSTEQTKPTGSLLPSFVPPLLMLGLQHVSFIYVARLENDSEFLVIPRESCANEDACRSKDFWEALVYGWRRAEQELRSDEPELRHRPVVWQLAFNFMEWEIGELGNCHAHAHILLTSTAIQQVAKKDGGPEAAAERVKQGEVATASFPWQPLIGRYGKPKDNYELQDVTDAITLRDQRQSSSGAGGSNSNRWRPSRDAPAAEQFSSRGQASGWFQSWLGGLPRGDSC
jgi:hypothetical protein